MAGRSAGRRRTVELTSSRAARGSWWGSSGAGEGRKKMGRGAAVPRKRTRAEEGHNTARAGADNAAAAGGRMALVY